MKIYVRPRQKVGAGVKQPMFSTLKKVSTQHPLYNRYSP